MNAFKSLVSFNILAISIFLLTITPLASQETFGLLWEPEIVMDGQLFPSYIWANSTHQHIKKYELYEDEAHQFHRGDPEGQLGVSFQNITGRGLRIKVQVECNDILEPSSYETFVSEDIVEFEIYPEITYKWKALLEVDQPRPVSVKFSVWADGNFSGEQVKTVSLRSINDCPYTFINKYRSLVDLNFMYAAYVNEGHPRIANEVLPGILKQEIISQVVGYQAGSEEVYKQVFAVWNYLRDLGISYSSLSAPTIALSKEDYPFVKSQYVRTFDDALNTAQANCVDGTVAMASILYRMGIDPIIAITPYHCFLGFIADGNGEKMDFIETTMLGSRLLPEELEVVPQLTDDIYNEKLDAVDYDSYRSFLAAVFTGRSNYGDDEANFNSYSRLDALRGLNDENESEMIDKLQYQLFTVDKFRQEGLLPIAGH